MLAVLISPYPDITSYGLRTISAWLKQEGHATRLIFLPDPFGDDLQAGVDRYPAAVIEQTAGLCRDADLVGISLMTNYFDNAAQLTDGLKAAGVHAPVLWGGVHATIRPAQCLEHADIVCQGDGEEAAAQLLDCLGQGRDYAQVANLWLKRDGQVIGNAPRPLTQDLDQYPIPDYSHDDHWVLMGEKIVPLTLELTGKLLARGTVSEYLGMAGYQTMTGRGCPHKCSYCINDTLKNLYGAKGYLRWRSTEHVMKELAWVREHMPFVGFIWISDDAFFARKLEDIKEFCRQYKEKVGLPFSALASPLTMSEEKMALLMDAG
ncbi:MAG: B12-binding domain-containing radical SAM protein, partial [Desulfovibrio sp.]|nr:B12-binding domain-containing radical SAM protein [Desulfovibrio sp.]